MTALFSKSRKKDTLQQTGIAIQLDFCKISGGIIDLLFPKTIDHFCVGWIDCPQKF